MSGDYIQTQRDKSRTVLSGPRRASAEAGGVTQVRVAVAARSPQALLGSALPGNLELHDPPQVGASRPRTSHTGFVL